MVSVLHIELDSACICSDIAAIDPITLLTKVGGIIEFDENCPGSRSMYIFLETMYIGILVGAIFDHEIYSFQSVSPIKPISMIKRLSTFEVLHFMKVL